MSGRRDALDWLAGRDSLRVAALHGRRFERLGYAPASTYVETFWLPLIGPSATLILRRLSAWLEAEPDGLTVQVGVLGQCLGLGKGTGRHSPTVRSLARLTKFNLADIDDDVYRLRAETPMLNGRQLARLPAALVTAHEQLIQGSTRSVVQASARPASASVMPAPGDTRPSPHTGLGPSWQ
jgi:hypothetical protein